jgi:hypothetical protein
LCPPVSSTVRSKSYVINPLWYSNFLLALRNFLELYAKESMAFQLHLEWATFSFMFHPTIKLLRVLSNLSCKIKSRIFVEGVHINKPGLVKFNVLSNITPHH